jgi:molybdopterin synthase catalytic subunit
MGFLTMDDAIFLTTEELPSGAANAGDHGAVLHFSGVVRGMEGGRPISGITYSAYESMATQQLRAVVAGAQQACGVAYPTKLVHRLGFVPTGVSSVTLEVSAPHSREAFDYCQDVLRRLKAEVPIWKEFVYSQEA